MTGRLLHAYVVAFKEAFIHRRQFPLAPLGKKFALDQGTNLYQAYEEGLWSTGHLGQTPWLNGDADARHNEPEDNQEARRRTLTGIDLNLWTPSVGAINVTPGDGAGEPVPSIPAIVSPPPPTADWMAALKEPAPSALALVWPWRRT